MKLEYQCRFCKLDGEVDLPEEGLDMFQVEKFKPILCCNRCGDFMNMRRESADRIKKVAELLIQQRGSKNPDKTVEVTRKVREIMTMLTKRYSTLVNNHFRKPNVWHEDFVDLLMEKPEFYQRILKDYIKHRSVA
jgi:hypothetical protein